LNVKDLTRTSGGTTLDSFDKWASTELELNNKFGEAKSAIHAALCGKFIKFKSIHSRLINLQF